MIFKQYLDIVQKSSPDKTTNIQYGYGYNSMLTL